MQPADEYTPDFYDQIRSPAQLSAAVVVPDIIKAIKLPATVIDVGCGEGHWAKEFEQFGATVLGIDGEYVEAPVVPYRAVDLADPLPADLGRFDMAVCLEVAEHLLPERAQSFVEDLCSLSDLIVFSAATPQQPGYHHVNCQWPAYWADLFAHHGYAMSGAFRWQYWGRDDVEWWYQQNLMVVTNDPTALPDLFYSPMTTPHAVVHPTLWNWSVTE